jgi:DNA-binding NarL/FixJ family response regulator
MQKRRVLLICSEGLFGEGMERVLRAAEDVELIGPYGLQDGFRSEITETHPSVVIIADEDSQSEAVTHLTQAIIEQSPALSVICAGLTENVVRVFSTYLLPARGIDVLETIRTLPAGERLNSSETKD